jgi:hypothetical protein
MSAWKRSATRWNPGCRHHKARHKCRGCEHTTAKLLGDVVDLVGIEPTTSSMPWKRAPSCATGPRENTAALQRCTRGGATQFSPTGW